MMGPQVTHVGAMGAFPARRFAATRISRAVEAEVHAPARHGTIESVHRSAVNVRWGSGLLTIAHESTGGLPNGILVDPPVPLDQIGLAVGMTAESDGAALRIPSAPVVIFLSGAALWSPAMPIVGGLAPAVRRRRAQSALRLAAAEAPRVGLGPLLTGMADGHGNVGSLGRHAAGCLLGIVGAVQDRNAERAVKAAVPLIGLGPGATPSGDDLLVGLAAGLAVIDHPLARAFASGVAAAGHGLTTSLAETYLAHAGRLEFAERVHVTALAVLTAPDAELRGAVSRALAWGASSGADLMVGLLVGMLVGAPGLPEQLRACGAEGTVAA